MKQRNDRYVSRYVNNVLPYIADFAHKVGYSSIMTEATMNLREFLSALNGIISMRFDCAETDDVLDLYQAFIEEGKKELHSSICLSFLSWLEDFGNFVETRIVDGGQCT